MIAVNNAPERARWEVCWVRDGKIHRAGTGSDFHEALRIFTLAVQSKDRTNVTLRSQNMAFPPPERLQPRLVRFDKPRRLRGAVVSEVRVVPMSKLNRQGLWWCPYCVKLRRFVFKQGAWTTEGVWMDDPRMQCPMCSVTHSSFGVRQWNPMAVRLFYDQPKRDPYKPPRRTRRRRKKEE